jgi:CRP-like cAMP-binding protein
MPQPQQLVVYRKSLEHFLLFTDEEWSIFSEQLYIRNIKKRQLFVGAGKICNEVGFILSGSFRFYIDKEESEISNYFCFEGDLISSYKSFLRKEPSFTTIEAMENASVICFNDAGLAKLVNDDRIAFKMERFGRLVAEYLVCCYEDRLVTFVTKSPEERYLELLEKQPALLQRIPQYYLANFLGITPVSLSRIRRRLYDEVTMKKEKV